MQFSRNGLARSKWQLRLFATPSSKHKEFMRSVYLEEERPSDDQDVNKQLMMLRSSQEIDLNKAFMSRLDALKEQEELVGQEGEAAASALIEQKLKEQEKSRIEVSLSNKHSLRLMQETSAKVLCELAVRVYVGNRQIPKDEEKCALLLELAE